MVKVSLHCYIIVILHKVIIWLVVGRVGLNIKPGYRNLTAKLNPNDTEQKVFASKLSGWLYGLQNSLLSSIQLISCIR